MGRTGAPKPKRRVLVAQAYQPSNPAGSNQRFCPHIECTVELPASGMGYCFSKAERSQRMVRGP